MELTQVKCGSSAQHPAQQMLALTITMVFGLGLCVGEGGLIFSGTSYIKSAKLWCFVGWGVKRLIILELLKHLWQEISALADGLVPDKYTQYFWSHPLLLVRRILPFGVNSRDKNKALQITISLINAVEALGFALRPTGKCSLTKTNVVH